MSIKNEQDNSSISSISRRNGAECQRVSFSDMISHLKPAGRKMEIFTVFRLDTTVSQGHTRSLRRNKPQDCSCLKGGRGQPQHSINLDTSSFSFLPSFVLLLVLVLGHVALTREIYLWVDLYVDLPFKKVGIHEVSNDLKVWTYTERVTCEDVSILPLRLAHAVWNLNS